MKQYSVFLEESQQLDEGIKDLFNTFKGVLGGLSMDTVKKVAKQVPVMGDILRNVSDISNSLIVIRN